MKKHLLFLIIFVCFFVRSNGQTPNGYIVLNSGDKIDVTIKIKKNFLDSGTSFYALQWKIKYYDNFLRKQKIKISLVKELYFKIGTDEYRMVAFKNTMKIWDGNHLAPKYILLFETQKGSLSNYSFKYSDSPKHVYSPQFNSYGPGVGYTGGGYSYSTSRYDYGNFINVLVLDGKPPIKLTKLKFKKPLLKYLANCKEVVTKIENETYGKKDLKTIVEEYNKVCN
jgi:hypothetical protein